MLNSCGFAPNVSKCVLYFVSVSSLAGHEHTPRKFSARLERWKRHAYMYTLQFILVWIYFFFWGEKPMTRCRNHPSTRALHHFSVISPAIFAGGCRTYCRGQEMLGKWFRGVQIRIVYSHGCQSSCSVCFFWFLLIRFDRWGWHLAW